MAETCLDERFNRLIPDIIDPALNAEVYIARPQKFCDLHRPFLSALTRAEEIRVGEIKIPCPALLDDCVNLCNNIFRTSKPPGHSLAVKGIDIAEGASTIATPASKDIHLANPIE